MTVDEKPIALIDMDGTLADYTGAVMAGLEKIRSGEDLHWTPEDEDTHPWLKERIRMIKRQPNFWLDLEPLLNGFIITGMLIEEGYELHILSRGPYNLPEAWDQKFRWCRKYLPTAKITITHDKSLVYGRILVDDWPDYVVPWLEHRPRGLVIMPAQPWNENFQHPNVIRFDGSDESIAKVRAAIKAQKEQHGT